MTTEIECAAASEETCPNAFLEAPAGFQECELMDMGTLSFICILQDTRALYELS